MINQGEILQMKKMQKGFTLIELLVVIAIIGLLATIALASLNSARSKSADASVKANMGNMSAQAELYYDENGSYGNITSCANGVFLDPVITNQINTAKASANTAVATCTGDGTATSEKWAITIGVLKGAGGYWCIDNSGNKKAEVAEAGSAGGICL